MHIPLLCLEELVKQEFERIQPIRLIIPGCETGATLGPLRGDSIVNCFWHLLVWERSIWRLGFGLEIKDLLVEL